MLWGTNLDKERSKLASIASLPANEESKQPDSTNSALGKRSREEPEPQESELNPETNFEEGEGDEGDTPYDPMDLANNPLDYGEAAKRFKTSEEDDFDDDDVPPLSQSAPHVLELDDSNSIKLKKGNLVVRKFKDGVEELHEMQTIHGYEVLHPKPVNKSVKYHPDTTIEAVKFFKKDAEPNAPALSIAEVQQIQKDLETTRAEEKKAASQFSNEQQRVDGINKDKKRVLENLQKVS